MLNVRGASLSAGFSRVERRFTIGLIVGAIAGFGLLAPTSNARAATVTGAVLGAVFACATQRAAGAYFDSAFTAAALTIAAWGVESVFVQPPNVPRLIGWMLYGLTLGLGVALVRDALARVVGIEADAPPQADSPAREVVVLGGGFAGIATAQHIEKLLGADRSVHVTLVSDTNALLFTPMLAEVAASSIEPTHISTPVRSSLRRTTVIRARATEIDLKLRRVTLDAPERTLDYDQLVLAVGSVSNFLGLENVSKHSLRFRTLSDAIRIRNHVIEMLEKADREPHPQTRRRLLTFVIAGGGFAGAELAGGLNDFARGALVDYPHLEPAEITVLVVHSGARILPELSASLGEYARGRMEARGVTFRLSTRVSDAAQGIVHLNDGEDVEAETLIWTAGTKPHPLVASLLIALDKRGAAIVDETLAVPGQRGLWALGDCAAAPDARTGRTHPPTAQVAIRQAVAVARNVCATLSGARCTPARFASLGALCVVGHRTACAELSIPFVRNRSVRFSGTFAWLMWRGIYLAKLPGFERKVRVLFDWVVELFFPRDIAQTLDLS